MFELGPGLQHPSEQLAVLEKGAGLRSHTFPPVLSTVGPDPPDPRAGRGTPGHPREGCGLGLAPWGWRSRRPFPRVFLRRISEGRAPRGGGDTQTEGLPWGLSPDPPHPGRGGGCGRLGGSQQTAIAACSGGAHLGRSAAPCPRGRARRGQRARPSVCPAVCPSPPRRGVPSYRGHGGARRRPGRRRGSRSGNSLSGNTHLRRAHGPGRAVPGRFLFREA